MNRTAPPSPETLRKLLRYEPDTGRLFWRERPAWMFKDGAHSALHACNRWNSRLAGKEAFTAIMYGYKAGAIFNRTYYAHRVIWAMETGEWPVDQIDHEDHNRANNKWLNLCEASHQENMKNQSLRSTNTSGITGVSWHKGAKKWHVQIRVNGRKVHLGYFHDLNDAITARVSANIEYGFHANHGE